VITTANGTTNEDGLLTFPNLQPGTYRLKEIGRDWCHAESDNVNANGDLLVKAGQVAKVWIFNCLPTKQPPNTGAGPLAAAGPLTGGMGGLGLMLGLVWPVIGFGAFRFRRRRWAA
jgi:hypothetical protein